MRKGGGKQKGSAFERDICRKLSLWVSHGKHDDLFWRSAASGARATVHFKQGRQNRTQAGDISAIGELGHKLTDRFLIECKHYSDAGLQALLFGTGNLQLFWSRAYKDAEKYAFKLPMLIVKENRREVLLLTTQEGAGVLKLGDPKVRSWMLGADVYFLDHVLERKFPL